MSSYNKRKKNLHKQNPHCHWCKKKTILLTPGFKGKVPDNAATIDHVKSRPVLDWGEKTTTVLACRLCNHTRNEIDKRQNAAEHYVHEKAMQAKRTVEKFIELTGRLVDLPQLIANVEVDARAEFVAAQRFK